MPETASAPDQRALLLDPRLDHQGSREPTTFHFAVADGGPACGADAYLAEFSEWALRAGDTPCRACLDALGVERDPTETMPRWGYETPRFCPACLRDLTGVDLGSHIVSGHRPEDFGLSPLGTADGRPVAPDGGEQR